MNKVYAMYLVTTNIVDEGEIITGQMTELFSSYEAAKKRVDDNTSANMWLEHIEEDKKKVFGKEVEKPYIRVMAPLREWTMQGDNVLYGTRVENDFFGHSAAYRFIYELEVN